MEWQGQRAMDIARMALVSAELRAPICPHTSHIMAEVVEAYRKEFAVSLGDVLLRRIPVALGRLLVGVVQSRGGGAHWRRAGLERTGSGSESGIVRDGADCIS